MSDEYSQQQSNPTMMGYVSQQMQEPVRLTTAYLFMFVIHLFDFAYFQFEFSFLRCIIYAIVVLIILKGLSVEHGQIKSTLIALFLIFALFFAVQNFLIEYLFPSLDFIWGEWIQKVLFVVLPFILLSFFYKKLTGGSFNPHYGVMAVYFYVTFVLPLLGELMQNSVILQQVGTDFFGIAYQTVFEFFVFVIPAWMWFLNSFNSSEKLPKFARFFEITVLLFLIVISLLNNVVIAQDGVLEGGYQGNPVETSWIFFTKGINSAVSAATGEVTRVVNETRSSLNFESDVERGAERDMGMNLATIDASQSQFTEGDPLAFFSVLESKQFDSDVYAQVSCRFEQQPDGINKDGILDGILNTDQNIFVKSYLNYDLSCELPFLPGGRRYDVAFNTKFDFVTSSYLKRYFIKEDLLDELAQSGDPARAFFTQYQISDTNPVSIHTAGPVKLALTTPNIIEPLTQDAGERTSFRLRMGISNQREWDGQIYGINDILLSIPFGFSIERGGVASGFSCTLGGFESNMSFMSEDECNTMSDPFKQLDCTNYYHFRITPTSENARTSIQVDKSNSAPQELVLGCDIQATNPNEILGGASFSVDSFRARVAYTYEIEETKSFRVDERSDDSGVAIADETLESLMYCSVPNAYLIEPNYELVFSYNDKKENEFDKIKETILSSDSTFASSTDLAVINDLGCFEKNIFWAHSMQFWDQVSKAKTVGGVYYGYMRTTFDMWEYVYEQDNSVVSNPEFMSTEQKEDYLEQNNVLIGSMYLSMMRESCKQDSKNPQLPGENGEDDLVCAVGKYVCGKDFVYGDYTSCSSNSLCSICHDRLIPNIVTLATQTEYYTDET